MTYTPEELHFIARVVNDWDSETEADLLSELDAQVGSIPDELLGISTLEIKQNFDEFHTQMLRRHAALLVLRSRAIQSCDELVAHYANEIAQAAAWMSEMFPQYLIPGYTNHGLALLERMPVTSLELEPQAAFSNTVLWLNRALMSLWTDLGHEPMEVRMSRDALVTGFELCINPQLQEQLLLFDLLKGLQWYSEPGELFSITNALNDLFVRIGDALTNFANAFIENPIAAFIGVIDGFLEGIGFYALVDAVIYGLESLAYGLRNTLEARGWMEYTGVRVAEFGATRAYAADVFWLAVEGLGGEDVRNSAAFQDTRNVSQAVTTVVSFFQGIKGLYNLAQFLGRSAGASVAAVGAMVDDVADVMVVGGIVRNGNSAALSLQSGRSVVSAGQWARVAAAADSVPWARAAVALNAVHDGIFTFSAGDDQNSGFGATANDDAPTAGADLPRTPAGHRVTPHAAQRIRERFNGRLQRVDEIIANPSHRYVQGTDGSTVYVQRLPTRSRQYDIVVVNTSDPNGYTIVTVMYADSPHALDNLAQNHLWQAPNPFD